MSLAFATLAQNGKGMAAHLSAKFKAQMCSKSSHMLRRQCDAVVRAPVSDEREICAPACSVALGVELRDMLGFQMASFCQLR